MKITCSTKIRTMICRASDKKVVKRSKWIKNLFLDAGLNSMAGKSTGLGASTPATAFSYVLVGSGTNANSFASGAITFTQAATTVTASAGFFTAAMVGGILKYGTGTGGLEQYITAFTDSTHVTVGNSFTQASPIVGTVWMVQQTALQTFLYNTNNYVTTGGGCGTTISGSNLIMQRTYAFPVQGSTYTVNEIGYSNGNTQSICGRVVLPSSDVVTTAFFYVVQIAITYTFSPTSPTAIANVGTNINTAGNIMLEYWDGYDVNSSGGAAIMVGNSAGCFGNDQLTQMWYVTSTYSQNANTANSLKTNANNINQAAGASWVFNSSLVGVSTLTFTINLTTTGQTCYGMGLSSNINNNSMALDILFTTPQTLPNGSFQGTVVWQRTYGRNLSN